jgi:uncharacterized protein
LDKSTAGREAEITALRELYAGINRNDVPAVLALLDPETEWTEPSEYPEGGTTRGIAAVEAILIRARGTWAEGGCEPERFVVAGDNIVVVVHVRVRLKDQAEWLDGHLADVYTLRNGKILQKRTFDEPHQAFEWVGVAASEAI